LTANPYQSGNSFKRQLMPSGRTDGLWATSELPGQADGTTPFSNFGSEDDAVLAVPQWTDLHLTALRQA